MDFTSADEALATINVQQTVRRADFNCVQRTRRMSSLLAACKPRERVCACVPREIPPQRSCDVEWQANDAACQFFIGDRRPTFAVQFHSGTNSNAALLSVMRMTFITRQLNPTNLQACWPELERSMRGDRAGDARPSGRLQARTKSHATGDRQLHSARTRKCRSNGRPVSRRT
jgi:hypothetical protein